MRKRSYQIEQARAVRICGFIRWFRLIQLVPGHNAHKIVSAWRRRRHERGAGRPCRATESARAVRESLEPDDFDDDFDDDFGPHVCGKKYNE